MPTDEPGMILKTSADSALLGRLVRSIVPPFTFDLHKGQLGRIGVVGGSAEYTGAPYFSAISSLKVGADVPHVFCPREAAPIIKSYSPELIVHPVLNADTAASAREEAMQRMHAFVIGPGLGRLSEAEAIFGEIMAYATGRGAPVVIDADGLFFVAKTPSIMNNVSRVVLTPNEMEFGRIYKSVMRADCAPSGPAGKAVEETRELCRRLGNITMVRKGACDLITDGEEVFLCDAPNSPRRCGGQGDLLSGSMGAFLHWAVMAENKGSAGQFEKYGGSMIAAYSACLLTRRCNQLAFEKYDRSTTTTDMIQHIHPAITTILNQ